MDKLPQRWSHLLPQKLFDAFKDDFYAGPGNWKSFLDYEPTSPGGTQAGAPAGEETKTVALKGMRINGTVLEEYLGEENISAVVVPDHIETIGPEAFRGCELIRSVTIPENVRRIGRDAFRGCLRLEKW